MNKKNYNMSKFFQSCNYSSVVFFECEVWNFICIIISIMSRFSRHGHISHFEILTIGIMMLKIIRKSRFFKNRKYNYVQILNVLIFWFHPYFNCFEIFWKLGLFKCSILQVSRFKLRNDFQFVRISIMSSLFECLDFSKSKIQITTMRFWISQESRFFKCHDISNFKIMMTRITILSKFSRCLHSSHTSFPTLLKF